MGNRSIVIAVHGIRTEAKWQKEIATPLAEVHLTPYLLDYGYFSEYRLITPWERERQLDAFKKSYDAILAKSGIARPSIVCHSFGSWLTTELLMRYHYVEFDKVILVGSIVRRDYPWAALLNEGRVLRVHNHVGTIDPWPGTAERVAGALTLWMGRNPFGKGGVEGFTDQHPMLTQDFSDTGHSDAFGEEQFRKWSSLLRAPSMTHADVDRIQLDAIHGHAVLCQALGLDASGIRMAIYILDGEGRLRVPHPSLAFKLTEKELALRVDIRTQEAVVSKAYRGNRAVVETNPLPLQLDAPLPNFIAAAPIRVPGDGRVIGVVSIDSLEQGLNLPEPAQMKYYVTILANKVGAAYVDNANGY